MSGSLVSEFRELRIEEHAARLQALRGIAALCVTVGHCFLSLRNGRIEQPDFALSAGNALLALCEIAIQPNSAVVFFYVLSGLVLGESLRRRPAWPSFAVRRLWRLLPVMWISIAFGLLGMAATAAPPFPGATRWFEAFFERSLAPWEVFTDLVGLTWNVNSVLWSVQIELAMIGPLPALLLVAERLTLRSNLVLWASLALGSLACWGKLPLWANAGLYLYCFHAGLILPRLLRDPRARVVFGQRRICCIGLLVLLVGQLLYVTNRLWLPHKFILDTLISVQALGCLISRPELREARMLAARPLVWLGDVSYSLYAYSMPIQLVIASWVLSALDAAPDHARATLLTLCITLGTVGCALLLAALSYRWVELPSIAIGRRWSSAVEARARLGEPRAV